MKTHHGQAPGKESLHVYIDGRLKKRLRRWAKKQERHLNIETERLLRQVLDLIEGRVPQGIACAGCSSLCTHLNEG